MSPTILHPHRLWWLHIAAVWALSVAQPLLNLVGGNPDFLVAHGFDRAGVLGLAVALVLLGPLPLVQSAASTFLTVPTTFAGAFFYVQAHSLDAGSTWPVGVASSNGLQVYPPATAAPSAHRVTTLYTYAPYPTYPSAQFFVDGIGTGLVTEFTW